MPYKVKRGRYDSIDPNVCTAYALGGVGGVDYNIPSIDDPGWGITGYLSRCGGGTAPECKTGYTEVGRINRQGDSGVDGMIRDNDSGQVKGQELDEIVNLYNKQNSDGRYIHTYTVPNAQTDHCGNLCSKLGDGIEGCNCGAIQDRRRICKRDVSEFPYEGNPIKCCLEADPGKLLEMDCDPKYFKTTDQLDMSEACHIEQGEICVQEPAFNPDTMEIDGEYVKFCGCAYPQEFYDNISLSIIENFPGITQGQLGTRECYAPTCTNADEAAKPITGSDCPPNNFQSCIQSIVLDNNGIIDGTINVSATMECQQFFDDSNDERKGGGPGGITYYKFTCDGEKCIRDDEKGEYNTEDCDKKCEPEDDYLWLWILIGVVVLLIIGAIGIYILSGESKNNEYNQ